MQKVQNLNFSIEKIRSKVRKVTHRPEFQLLKISTLINSGKSTDVIQSLVIDCYGDQAFTRRSIRRIRSQVDSRGDGNDQRRGPSSWIRTNSNIDLIKNLVDQDGRLTIMEMAEMTNLSKTTIYRILKIDLGYSIK